MGLKEEAKKREDEWFLKKERKALDKIRLQREERLRRLAEEEDAKKTEALREAHWMKCPKCGNDMATKEEMGIELDVCTRCEGLYFDRGELEEFFFRRAKERRTIFRKFLGI